MYLNKVMLIGNVGKDPNFHATPEGGSVAHFSMATNEAASDGRTFTRWHQIVAWNGLTKVVQYLSKGRLVYVEGRLTYEKYEGRIYTRIVAEKIRYLDSRKEQSQPAAMEAGAAGAPGMSQEALF